MLIRGGMFIKMIRDFDKYIQKFEEVNIGFIYNNFKKVSSFCIYDKQNYES
mgnify:FL=1